MKAAAEKANNVGIWGPIYKSALQMLDAAIETDSQMEPDFLGYMNDPSVETPRLRKAPEGTWTHNGVDLDA
jgi:hypothetical protein